MRLLTALVVLALLASAGVARPASAAVVPFTGTMTVRFGTLATVSVPGSGLATVNGSAGGHPITSLALPAGAFAASATVPVANAFPIVQMAFRFQNGPIVVAGGGCTAGHPYVSCPGGGLNGFGGLSGTALVGFFTKTTHTAGSATSVQPGFNLAVPLSVVGGGSSVMTAGGGLTVRVSGAGWTTGTVGIYNPTASILTHIPSTFHVFPTVTFMASTSIPYGYGSTVTIMGSRNTNPGSTFTTDTITLVSPVQIFTNALGPSGQFIPSSATLTIHLVPEPGTLVLLATGIAGFAVFGHRLGKR